MFQTLQRVYAAMSQVQTSLPPTAKIEAHRLRFSSFPILGFGLTSDTMPATKLWEMATYDIKPRLNRVNGVATVDVQGGQVPEFDIVPDPAKLLRTSVTVTEILEAVRRTNLIQSPGLIAEHHDLVLDLVDGQVHDPERDRQYRYRHAYRCSSTHWRRGHCGGWSTARLYGGHG